MVNASGSDGIKFISRVDGVDYYYNTSSGQWESSDLSYSKANDIGDLTNEIMQALIEPDQGSTYTWIAVLHSEDGSTTPDLDSVTLDYDYYNSPGDAIPECTIFMSVIDLLGDEYDEAWLYVAHEEGFYHGDRFILPFEKNKKANEAGYIGLSVPETETVQENCIFYLKYTKPDDTTMYQIDFRDAIVPNLASKAASQLLVVD